MMSMSYGEVNLDKTYKPWFEWSKIDPGAGKYNICSYCPIVLN